MEGVCLIDVMEGGSLADVMREFPYVYKKILFEMEVQKKILHHKIIIISISLKNCNFSQISPKQTIIGTNFIEQNRQMFLIYKDFKHWEHIVVLFTQVSVLGFFLFRQIFTIYLYKSFS